MLASVAHVDQNFLPYENNLLGLNSKVEKAQNERLKHSSWCQIIAQIVELEVSSIHY